MCICCCDDDDDVIVTHFANIVVVVVNKLFKFSREFSVVLFLIFNLLQFPAVLCELEHLLRQRRR